MTTCMRRPGVPMILRRRSTAIRTKTCRKWWRETRLSVRTMMKHLHVRVFMKSSKLIVHAGKSREIYIHSRVKGSHGTTGILGHHSPVSTEDQGSPEAGEFSQLQYNNAVRRKHQWQDLKWNHRTTRQWLKITLSSVWPLLWTSWSAGPTPWWGSWWGPGPPFGLEGLSAFQTSAPGRQLSYHCRSWPWLPYLYHPKSPG